MKHWRSTALNKMGDKALRCVHIYTGAKVYYELFTEFSRDWNGAPTAYAKDRIRLDPKVIFFSSGQLIKYIVL